MPAPPPPAPPPPPPPPPKATNASSGNNVGAATSALFAEINQGDAITKHLRHVKDEEKSHKNPALRKAPPPAGSSPQPKPAAKGPATAAAAAGPAPVSPPVLRLEGDKRMLVQHQRGTPAKQLQLPVEKLNMRHAVRIEHCEHAFIEIKDKVNTVTVMNCKKVQVSLQSVVANVEIIKCQSVDIQVAQAAPTVTVEGSNSINIYLIDKDEARKTEIVTSCCTSLNVLFKSAKNGDDLVERPIPEQFVSKIVSDGKGGYKVETKPNESLGG